MPIRLLRVVPAGLLAAGLLGPPAPAPATAPVAGNRWPTASPTAVAAARSAPAITAGSSAAGPAADYPAAATAGTAGPAVAAAPTSVPASTPEQWDAATALPVLPALVDPSPTVPTAAARTGATPGHPAVVAASTGAPGSTDPGRPGTPAPSAPPLGPEFGVQFHGMWSDYTDAQRAQVLDQLAAAGARRVRIDLSWAMLQPTGRNAFDPWGVAFADRVLAMATSRGLRPLVTLWLTPEWANGGAGEHVLPADPGDYARVARWAAARWRGQVDWEVWNEPNDPQFLAGADPAAYTALLRAAYPAFHAGDPGTRVVFGGPSYNDDGYLARAYAAGAHGFFDVMATHPYLGVADLPPSTPDDGTKWTLLHVAAVRDLLVRHGDGDKPIWFTEFGWSAHPTAPGAPNWERGVTLQQQARYLVDTLRLVRASLPYVTAVFWYTDRVRVSGDPQVDNYGLLTRDLQPRPALLAVRAYLLG